MSHLETWWNPKNHFNGHRPPKAFEATKFEICEQIKCSMHPHFPGNKTAFVKDWCRTLIGYVLMQKYCKCTSIVLSEQN